MKILPHALLDLRGLVMRSYHSGEPSQTVLNAVGKAVPHASHAVHEFVRWHLNPILQDFAPIQIIAALEGAHGNTRRRAIYPQYKIKKSLDEDDAVMNEQKQAALDAVQSLLLGLGAMLVKTPYCEADETIAYLAERLEGSKIIHTVDQDLLQLVSPTCGVVMGNKNTASFKGMNIGTEHDEVPAKIVWLHKSILGDDSDGYIGVKGMGKAAWDNMVELYGYDGMLELADAIATDNKQPLKDTLAEQPCKYIAKLLEAWSEWRVSYLLAILHPEWCERSYNDKVVRPQWAKRLPSEARLRAVLEPLGLDYFIPEFAKWMPRQWLIDKTRWEQTKKEMLLNTMRLSPIVAFDWETYDAVKHGPYQEAKKSGEYVDVLNSKLTGGSFCFGENLQHTFYMTVKHRDNINCSPDDLKEVLGAMHGLRMVAHNAAFEQTVAKLNLNYEFDNQCLPLDTQIMSSYVDENERPGLKLLSKHYLNYDQTNYRDVVPHGKDMRDISGGEVLHYGADDSFVTGHLAVLFSLIMQCERTWNFYTTYETYFDKAMLPSYIKGIPIDYVRLKALELEDDALYNKTDKRLRELLTEYCSDPNLKGLEVLFPEAASFRRATMESKGKTAEQIEAALDDLYKEYAYDAKYHPLEAPKPELTRNSLSTVAKLLRFTGIRSLKEDWIKRYTTGLLDQCAAMTAKGEDVLGDEWRFLEYLAEAAPLLELASHTKLEADEEFEDPRLNQLLAFVNRTLEAHRNIWGGDELNVGSSLQMAKLFYMKMGLPIRLRNFTKATDKDTVRSLYDLEGAPSTNENAIRTWLVELPPDSWQSEVLHAILTIRAIRTRRQLYYVPYPLWASPIDGNIHPGIRNCGTITRRPTCSSPNVLQVSKTKDDGHMRSTFLPLEEGHVVFSIDFVQQELVILAGESNDKNLRACYVGDVKRDVHTTTGVEIYNNLMRRQGKRPVTYDEYNALVEAKDKEASDIRKVYAKRTNFLTVYGGGPSGLARKLIVPQDMAEAFLDSFHKSYPKVGEWQEKTISFARQHGFVMDCFGNRKHMKGIFDKNKAIRAGWERQGINCPIQGGAASVLKTVMRGVVLSGIVEKTKATIYAPIYDELVGSVPREHAFELLDKLADLMEIWLPGLNIQLSTSVSLGKNWGEQVEIGTRPSRAIVEKAILEHCQ